MGMILFSQFCYTSFLAKEEFIFELQMIHSDSIHPRDDERQFAVAFTRIATTIAFGGLLSKC